MGAVDDASAGTIKAPAVLASFLGSLVGTLFHHGLGRFLLDRFLLRHTLSH
jgi:membrane protein DedA with SNARE-associated domain